MYRDTYCTALFLGSISSSYLHEIIFKLAVLNEVGSSDLQAK